MVRRLGLAAGVAFSLLTSAAPAWALQIISFDYPQHATPGEAVLFRITIQNPDAVAQFAEVDVTLTEIGTGRETTVVPVAIGTVPARGTLTITSTWTAVAGLFTVSLPLFDGNGTRVDRAAGSFPLHIGTNADTLHVFPDAIDLGSIPEGRFMYPTPLEIRWDFFRFNRFRGDQPFAVRIYTDNAAHYRGVPGALRVGSPAGLVSDDGRFNIPVKLWTVNFGPDVQETGWDPSLMGPPPVDDDTFWRGPLLTDGSRESGSVAWLRIPDVSEMSSDPGSWRRLIGQDPYDTRFAGDANVTGDFTLPSPVTVYLATEGSVAAVEGRYSGTLVVELYSP